MRTVRATKVEVGASQGEKPANPAADAAGAAAHVRRAHHAAGENSLCALEKRVAMCAVIFDERAACVTVQRKAPATGVACRAYAFNVSPTVPARALAEDGI